MPFLELFDETLDINSTENYDLSVQLCADSLSFTILDTIRNKYILLRSFTPDSYRNFSPDQVREIFSKDDFLGRRYRKVHAVMPSLKFTLVPSPLFDPGKKADYFSFNHPFTESDVILTNKITDPDSYLLFAVTRPFYEILKDNYPHAQPAHHLTPLFDLMMHARKSSGENYIHVHVESDFFNFFVFNNHSLQFSNAFSYRNISDILYHIFNVFRNLQLKQEETVYLSGLTERYDDLYSNLSLYVRNVKFAEPTGNFTFSYVFNDTALHKHINLFTVASCGS